MENKEMTNETIETVVADVAEAVEAEVTETPEEVVETAGIEVAKETAVEISEAEMTEETVAEASEAEVVETPEAEVADVPEAEVAEEKAAEPEAPAEEIPSMDEYSSEIDASFKSVEPGEILTGTVIAVGDEDVTLDLKYYAEGIIRAEDYSHEPGFSLKENVQVGEEISATVLRKDDGRGNILLSKVEANDVLAWDKLKQLKDDQTVLDVTVKGVVKAGAIAYVEGIRGFIPASKLSLSYVEDLEEFLNKPIKVQVFDIDPADKKLILSARELLRAKADDDRRQKISNVEVGLVTEGTVESIQPYGAFINLGSGLSGLVHISQICEKRIKTPAEVVAVGDKVKVKVTAVKDGKLSLSMKALGDANATEISEEVVDLPKTDELTTSLGDLFKNIKL